MTSERLDDKMFFTLKSILMRNRKRHREAFAREKFKQLNKSENSYISSVLW